jgi:phage host-nuclease inhibitor protein Gam
MSTRAMEALKVKLNQLEELVEKYSLELTRRASLRSQLVEDVGERLLQLAMEHNSEIEQLNGVVEESVAQCASEYGIALNELQSALVTVTQNSRKVVMRIAKKVARFCSASRVEITNLSNKLEERCCEFDTHAREIFEGLKRMTCMQFLPQTNEISLRSIRLCSLERRIAMLKKLRRESELEFERDLLQTELQSVQFHQQIDAVRAVQCCVVELNLCCHCWVPTNDLAKIASEVNDHLALFQHRRYDIAEDRIEYEKIYNCVLWQKLDAIQNLQLDLNVNLYFYFRAKCGRLDQEFHPESQSSADSREIGKLQQNITHLQKQIPRDRIAFQAEYQAMQSEYIVRVQELERTNGDELQKLYDQRDGLLGMYNERIEVLMKNGNAPSSIRERHLETVLDELDRRLARLKHSVRSRSFSI